MPGRQGSNGVDLASRQPQYLSVIQHLEAVPMHDTLIACSLCSLGAAES